MDKEQAEFKQWWNSLPLTYRITFQTDEYHWMGWQARQPEIDALKIEVERLRKEAALASPKVEPVAWITPGVDLHRENPEEYSDWTPLYTSPPSPKAEWSANGAPLNLLAAAEELCGYMECDVDTMVPEDAAAVRTLRKFLEAVNSKSPSNGTRPAPTEVFPLAD